MARLMFAIFIRDPDPWYDKSVPILGTAYVPLARTSCWLAAISHLDLYIHGCCGWIYCSQDIKISYSDGGDSKVRLTEPQLQRTSSL